MLLIFNDRIEHNIVKFAPKQQQQPRLVCSCFDRLSICLEKRYAKGKFIDKQAVKANAMHKSINKCTEPLQQISENLKRFSDGEQNQQKLIENQ